MSRPGYTIWLENELAEFYEALADDPGIPPEEKRRLDRASEAFFDLFRYDEPAELRRDSRFPAKDAVRMNLWIDDIVLLEFDFNFMAAEVHLHDIQYKGSK